MRCAGAVVLAAEETGAEKVRVVVLLSWVYMYVFRTAPAEAGRSVLLQARTGAVQYNTNILMSFELLVTKQTQTGLSYCVCRR